MLLCCLNSPPKIVLKICFEAMKVRLVLLLMYIFFFFMLSRSTLEPLISFDLVGKKFYCLRTRLHCYYCLYNIFSANTVTRSEELRGGHFFAFLD